MSELRHSYDLFYDLKTEQQLEYEVEYLVHRLAGIMELRREDDKSIDDYVRCVLKLPESIND